MIANPSMHKCAKKTKAEEAQKTTKKEEEQTEDVGMNLPQFDKGPTQILLKFQEWMISNDMGSENTTNLYLTQVKGWPFQCSVMFPDEASAYNRVIDRIETLLL